MKYAKYLILILLINVFVSAQTFKAEKVNEFISDVYKQLNLKTGMSIGVVIGNKIVFADGYGFVNIEDEFPATANSPFYIASSTKSFTAALAKLMQENDTLDIDKPISNYLPELKFENQILSSDFITMRGLLTHRSGIFNIPAVIRTAYTGQHTPEKLLEIYNASDFTTREFNYTNDGYVLTSMILDKVYDRPWQDLMADSLFKPLGMKNTSCRVSDYDSELLNAYVSKNGKVENVGFIKKDNTMHAAGGIITTAKDACNWLIFNLNNGKYNGRQILSKRVVSEIHSSQIGCSKSFWKYYRYAYGLGWYLSDYNNEVLIHHFGGYAGARAHISFMPEHNIGVVALTNDGGDGFYAVDLIADYIYNSYLNKNADEIAEEEIQSIIDKMQKEEEADKSEEKNFTSSYNYDLLDGYYSNDRFGEIIISNNNGLQMTFGNLESELIPISETTFSADLTSFTVILEFTEKDDRITELVFHRPANIVFKKE